MRALPARVADIVRGLPYEHTEVSAWLVRLKNGGHIEQLHQPQGRSKYVYCITAKGALVLSNHGACGTIM
jgi:DNA-binding MarR family transcriptional regulator